MAPEIPSRKRIFIGIILSAVGAGLVSYTFYLGAVVIYTGLGIIVWGTFVYFEERRAIRDLADGERQRNYLWSQQALRGSPPPPPPPPPPVPPPPNTYAVEYRVENRVGGVVRSTSFRTFNPAHQFYLHSPPAGRVLIRVTPDGQRHVIAPVPSETTPAPITPPRPSRAPQFERLVDFLERYRPSERFGREKEVEVELAQALRGEFGSQNVLRQVPVGKGRIDIEVCKIGLELKIAGSTSSLRGLPEQVLDYRRRYGPNLMVVILDDTGGDPVLARLKGSLAQQGIPVFVK